MGTTDNTALQAATQNLQSRSTAKADTKSATSGLTGSVGMGARNAPDDVMKVSGALTANGLMEAPQSHADATLFKGIIGAQERMDGSLKRDGLVNPGGPTERTFSRLAGQGFVKPVPAQPATGNPGSRPATGDAALNAELRVGNKQTAVAAAEARVKANLSDETRSDYRKAQDRHRLDKARDDAERAQARARHEQAEQRRRQREQQAAAQQKASTDARKQAIEARQAVSTGLTKIVNQAGKVLNEALQSSSRHSGASRNPVSTDALDPGQSLSRAQTRGRNDDGGTVDGGLAKDYPLALPKPPVVLSDAAIAANRRTSNALKRRTTVGDLPRFTVDAINTDGTKAVHEVADMIEQVHASDPEQAQELFARTARGIGAEDRARLEDLLRGGGVIDERLHGRLPGQPLDGALPDHRTKVLRLEDLGNPDDARRDMLHRPGQDKPEIMPLKAKAEAGTDQGSAAPDAGEPSAPQDALHDDWGVQHRKVADDGGNPELAQTPQPGNTAPPIPKDKKDWFKGKEKEWQDFYDATGKLPNMSKTEQAAYMHIFGREGGMAPDKRGSAASGIIQKTADVYLGKGDLKHAKPGTPPSSLSVEDRAKIYRHYMDDQFSAIGGHKVLEQIGDDKGAIALADGMFRLGKRHASEGIQEAMKIIEPAQPTPDGVFGSKTLATYKRLLADSKTRDRLLDAIGDRFTVKANGENERWDALRP